MLIEIVSHCWARDLPHYANALRYQLASVVLDQPKTCDVLMSICYCPFDLNTAQALDWFFNRADRNLVQLIPLSQDKLGRRSIGRNLAATHTEADVVWFADVDQVFRDGVLDKLASFADTAWFDETTMIYPREIMIHKNHSTGDRVLEEAQATTRLQDVDPSLFKTKKYNRAIGGVQIIKGDFAREHGYLKDSHRYQKPRKDGGFFGDFKDDIAFRRFCQKYGSCVGVDLPGMYRLRHSTTSYQ